MKHLLLTLLSAAAFSTLQAQTLKVYQGQVCTAFPAATVGDMTYASSGTLLTIKGHEFTLSEVDSIIVDESAYTESSVDVYYATDGKARLTISEDVATQLTASATAADVSIVASDALDKEINYTLHGTSADGSFYMDGAYKATFTLNGLTLANTRGAAITVDCGKRINVVVADGTVNTLSDGTGGTHKACFFINGHAEFKGSGTLNVAGNTKHAYASDEYTWFKPTFGTLNVTAAESDGLHVQQYFRQDGGTINVSGTKGDCVDVSITKDATDEFNGQAFLNAGTLTMDVAADDVKGLKTDSAVTIAGGTLSAEVSGLGTKGLSAGTDLVISQKTETATLVKMNVTGTTYNKDQADESKCRGIKVKGNFTFDGGTISMSVTGKKAKGISVDGTYTYVSGTTNVIPE